MYIAFGSRSCRFIILVKQGKLGDLQEFALIALRELGFQFIRDAAGKTAFAQAADNNADLLRH